MQSFVGRFVRCSCLVGVVVSIAGPAFAQLDVQSWTLVDPYNRWSKSHPTPTSCRMDETATSGVVGPGWVVSPFVLPATATFEMTVQSLGTGDDDFFGIAFSYESSTRHLLLDWKQASQSFNWGDTVAVNDDLAEVGMKIKRINGSFTRDGLWGGTDGLGVSTLAGPLAPGWVDNAVYLFQFSITPGRVVIRRNGVQIFDLSDPAVTAGRIAFYSFSQDDMVFSNVRATPTPGCIADVDDGSGTGTPDGGVGIEDLLYYLSVFDAGTTRADVDDGSGTGTPDGGVGIEDLLYYLSRYDAGC
jgi:hypothetical protein